MSEKINCDNCDMLLYFGEEIKRRLAAAGARAEIK